MQTDGGYKEYAGRLTELATQVLADVPWKRLRRYRLVREATVTGACGQYQPVPFPGITVLATPYPLANRQVLACQTMVCRTSKGFAPVPAETLHMTFADLLAGRSYGDLPRERRIEVTRRAAELIRAWHPPGRASVPIIGIGAFPGVAVAIVRLPPEWYEAVVHLRQHLYGDRLLRASFVCQGFPLLTHITLGYVESDWKSIAACLTALRNGSALGMTEVDGASVFRFPHMSRFDAA